MDISSRLGVRPWHTTQECEGKVWTTGTGGESAVRFHHPFHLPYFRSQCRTRHSYPRAPFRYWSHLFPNDRHLSVALALDACANLIVSTSHLLDYCP